MVARRTWRRARITPSCWMMAIRCPTLDRHGSRRACTGFSRTVDHSAFPWTDRDWHAPALSSAVMYELHLGTFTTKGTFESADGAAGSSCALGITHVELMPVQEFSGDWGWGYDGVDLIRPASCLWWAGWPEAIRRRLPSRGLSGSCWTWCTTTSGRTGIISSRFGPYFTENVYDSVGTRSKSGRRGQHGGAAVSVR